jgi:3-oxoadipate enol-lactonase
VIAHGIYSVLESHAEPTASVVTLVHAIGLDHTMWDDLATKLRRRYSVLRIDVRGHGLSDVRDGRYTLAELADDVAAVLDSHSIEKTHFVGLSLGGMIGQAFALQHPARLQKMVLACTSSYYGPEGAAMWNGRVKTVTESGTAALADASMQRFFSDAFRAAQPEIVAKYKARLIATARKGYVGCSHALAALDFSNDLAKIAAPTLVIAGELDVGTPPAMSEALTRGIPDARMATIAGAAHLAAVEKPEEFGALVEEFLSQQ